MSSFFRNFKNVFLVSEMNSSAAMWSRSHSMAYSVEGKSRKKGVQKGTIWRYVESNNHQWRKTYLKNISMGSEIRRLAYKNRGQKKAVNASIHSLFTYKL